MGKTSQKLIKYPKRQEAARKYMNRKCFKWCKKGEADKTKLTNYIKELHTAIFTGSNGCGKNLLALGLI